LGSGNGPEFNDKKYLNRGKYIPIIVPFSEIFRINLIPNSIKNKLINDLNKIFLKN